jgi:hypothetical protein
MTTPSYSFSSNNGNRIFRLNDIVRKIVKEKLKELEEPIVRITIDAFRKIVEEEKDMIDPFDCLKTIRIPHNNIIELNGIYKFDISDNITLNNDSYRKNIEIGKELITENLFSAERPISRGNGVAEYKEENGHILLNKDKKLTPYDDIFINPGENEQQSLKSFRADPDWWSYYKKTFNGEYQDDFLQDEQDDEDDEDEGGDDEDNKSLKKANDDLEDMLVRVKEIDGKNVYVYIGEDSVKHNGNCVYDRVINNDNESEIGDIIGFLDNNEEYWKVKIEKSQIVGFTKDVLYVPIKKDLTDIYPDWEQMEFQKNN